MSAELLIVIVNYRTSPWVAECLRTLEPEVCQLGARVVVVDGGSADDSAELLAGIIAARGYAWATLLPLRENRGFSAGNNAAIGPALAASDRPEYVFLLNPDTEVLPGALSQLLEFMRANPHAGIAGSRCENADGSARPSAFRFHSILGEIEHRAAFGPVSRCLERFAIAPPICDTPQRADWVSGAAMLVRSAVFDRIGLLDSEFFLYFEEADFARRAAAAGFECWHVPASRVVHHCGKATGLTGSDAAQTRVPAYWYESRRRYFEKHHGRAYATLADGAWLLASAFRRTRRADDPPKHYWDFLRFNARHWVTR